MCTIRNSDIIISIHEAPGEGTKLLQKTKQTGERYVDAFKKYARENKLREFHFKVHSALLSQRRDVLFRFNIKPDSKRLDLES